MACRTDLTGDFKYQGKGIVQISNKLIKQTMEDFCTKFLTKVCSQN